MSAETAWQAYDAQLALQRAAGLEEVESGPIDKLDRDERQAHLRNTLRATDFLIGDTLQGEREFVDAVEKVDLDGHPVMKAARGAARKASVTLSDALRQHIQDEEVANRNKSPNQVRKWTERRRRGVNWFIAAHGRDPDVDAITRDDAVRFHEVLRKRITEGEGGSTDTARKALAALRGVYRSHYERQGDFTRMNPFAGLSFPKDDDEEGRPAFSTDWIASRFLHGDGLSRLNDQARRIFLVMVETGKRPSEIANQTGDQIHLDAPHSYVSVRPRKDRAVKSKSSRRDVPLTGVALAAMRKHPNGFPDYLDREDALSATLMKHLKTHDLLESDRHVVYSLRHSYTERLAATGVSDDMRRRILGHEAKDVHSRTYLKDLPIHQKAEIMEKIALPFDVAIV